MIPTLDAFFFKSECKTDSINFQQRHESMRSVHWPSARNCLCAGRAGFPEILQIFRVIFAQNLRHLDAELARYLALERMPTRKTAATKLCGSRNHAGRVHETFVRAAGRIFFRNFAIFSRELGANFA